MGLADKIVKLQKEWFNEWIRHRIMIDYKPTTINILEKWFFKIQEFISGILQFMGLFYIFQLLAEKWGFEVMILAILIGQNLYFRKNFKKMEKSGLLLND